MLVYTAVPEKWKENIDEEPKFTIVGTPPKRGKRFMHNTYGDILTSTISTTISPPTILNVRRSSSRFPTTLDVEEQPSEEQFSIQSIEIDDANTVYEEIVLPEPSPRKFPKYVLRPKIGTEPFATEFTEVPPQKRVKQNEEEFYSEEVDDANISSSNMEASEEKKEEENVQETTNMTSDQLENYSEFIFNGEKYVQMPMRVFEAEKEKIRKESERCRLLLRKLKSHLSKMDLD